MDGGDGLLVHLQVYCGLVYIRIMGVRGTGVLLRGGSMLSSILCWVIDEVSGVDGVYGVRTVYLLTQ